MAPQNTGRRTQDARRRTQPLLQSHWFTKPILDDTYSTTNQRSRPCLSVCPVSPMDPTSHQSTQRELGSLSPSSAPPITCKLRPPRPRHSTALPQGISISVSLSDKCDTYTVFLEQTQDAAHPPHTRLLRTTFVPPDTGATRSWQTQPVLNRVETEATNLHRHGTNLVVSRSQSWRHRCFPLLP